MQRLLPDFYQPDGSPGGLGSGREPQCRAAQPARARDHRCQTCSGTTFLDTCPTGGGRFELTEADANAWVAAVNDVRLALGTMLEIGPRAPIGCPT